MSSKHASDGKGSSKNDRSNYKNTDDEPLDADRAKFATGRGGTNEEKGASPNSQDKFQIFESWMKENSCATPKLELRVCARTSGIVPGPSLLSTLCSSL